MTWLALEKLVIGKPTVTGMCVGFVAGLATITPPSGYVDSLPAMAIGIVSAFVGFFMIYFRKRMGFDDSLDVLAVHGFAAASGVLMTGIFADSRINVNLDKVAGSPANGGGWINHIWIQLAWQLCGLVVGVAWSGTVTWIICEVIDRTMGLRATKADELLGLDQAYHGENLYDMEAVVVKSILAVESHKNGTAVNGEVLHGSVELAKIAPSAVVNFHHSPDVPI